MRERAGVPLGDLAAQAGVCISTLRKFETGVPDLASHLRPHDCRTRIPQSKVAAMSNLLALTAAEAREILRTAAS